MTVSKIKDTINDRTNDLRGELHWHFANKDNKVFVSVHTRRVGRLFILYNTWNLEVSLVRVKGTWKCSDLMIPTRGSLRVLTICFPAITLTYPIDGKHCNIGAPSQSIVSYSVSSTSPHGRWIQSQNRSKSYTQKRTSWFSWCVRSNLRACEGRQVYPKWEAFLPYFCPLLSLCPLLTFFFPRQGRYSPPRFTNIFN